MDCRKREVRRRIARYGRGAGSRLRRRSHVTLAAAAGLVVLAAGCGGQASGSAPPGAGSLLADGGNSSISGSYGLVSPANHPPASRGSHDPGGPRGGSPGGSSRSGVIGGALFGGDGPLAAEQGRLGRKLAIVRVYYQIGDSFPGQPNNPLITGGSTMLVSLDSSGASYAAIAAGRQDAAISTFLRQVDQTAVRSGMGAIYICFQHEPDGPQHRSLGSPAQFVRAWDHVRQLAQSAHLDWNQGGRLHWVWILIHGSFLSARASMFWPGTSEVDIIAADGYNSSACKTANDGAAPSASADAEATPASLFNPVVGFAADHGGLPVFISEWGSDTHPSGVQPEFIHQMQSYVAANREIEAALYWDSGFGCNYSINGNSASVAALAAMGHSAAMQGRVEPVG